MKAFPALALLATIVATLHAADASAQSSVTIGGIADAAARHVDNGGAGSVSSLISGGNATSRLIVRGTEDLGGGLSAGFHLEHGIALDTGTPTGGSQFWDRRATLSLVSKSAGELRLGRDFVTTYVNWSRYDPFSHVGVASAGNLVTAGPVGPIRSSFGSSPNTTVRSSNAIQWLIPSGWGGVEGGLMVAAGEGGTAANGQHKVMGARLGWAGGGLGVAAAINITENNLTGDDELTDLSVGGSYKLGPARLAAVWRHFERADAEQDNLLLSVLWQVGNNEVKASWQKVDLSGRVGAVDIDGNGAQQIGLGYVHNLSKRTALYATVSRVDNDGAATYAVPGGPSGLAAGGASTGYEAGVRHTF